MRRHSKRSRKPRGNVESHAFTLKGGLNLVDAPLTMPEGQCIVAINYEALSREGYERTAGFERYDGQDSPSDQDYWILNFDAGGLVSPPEDTYCRGHTSGAFGKVGSVVLTSGDWAVGDAAGYLVLFGVSGSFIDDEKLGFTAAGDGFSAGFSNGFG